MYILYIVSTSNFKTILNTINYTLFCDSVIQVLLQRKYTWKMYVIYTL